MNSRARTLGVLGGALAASTLVGTGCFVDGDFFRNNTAPRFGSMIFIFVNQTPYRAAFTFGGYDDLDRTPGAVNALQIRVEGNSTTAPQTTACRRSAAIGTAELIRRAIDADFEDSALFNADSFGSVVNFSSAPLDSDANSLPTEGTAAGRTLLLGADYDCNDRLIITFVEDPEAEGGFRIDVAVVQDDDDDT